MSATPEAINSIEWAVLFAALVLSARLYSLIQASLGVDRAHAEVLEGLGKGNLTALERRTQGLGYQNPYGEIAAELINAAHREAKSEERRKEFVARAQQTMASRWRRRTRQGRLADLLTLFIGVIVVIYSRGLLWGGPLFWSCAGAMLVTLVATFAVRGLLLSNLLSSAEALRAALLNRSQLPSLSEGAHPCLWCGSKTKRCSYVLRPIEAESESVVEMTVCTSCGKLVGTVDLPPSPSKRK